MFALYTPCQIDHACANIISSYKLDPKLASYLEEFKDAQPDETLKDAVTLLTETVHVSSGKFFDSKAIGR